MIGYSQMANSSSSVSVVKTAKVVNYTPEQTANVVEQYIAGVTVEAIALAIGKSVRSVVAKLSRELKGTDNEYKAKTYATKAGEAVVKKDDLADSFLQGLWYINDKNI